MPSPRDRFNQVLDRMQRAAAQAGRSPDSVGLVAVSKKHPPDAIRSLFQAGQRNFGESYVQEALDKQTALSDLAIQWHFVGPVQSNKTQALASHFDWVHSVDRLKVAQRLSDQRPAELPPLNICLQVNIDREQSKRGASPEEVLDLANQVLGLPRLALRGLMAIPAPRKEFAAQLEAFSRVNSLLEELKTQCQCPTLDTLSMGMSGDLEAAIATGATMVRVGTDLFGERT